MEHLRDHTPETLEAAFPELPPGAARRVVRRAVFEDRDDLEGIRGLSSRLEGLLRERTRTTRLRVLDRRRSLVDPFVKYLFGSDGGATFETVRIPLERPRWSVCVSTQVGCGLSCDFCETGRMGFSRNLAPWEIVEQVLTVRREGPERPVTGVVFQGQGEPFQNYDNVMRAAAVLRHPCGGQIGSDRITISTVGILPMIERFTDEGHPYRLILSLTSAFQEKRSRLLPVGRHYDVAELARAMRRHARKRGTVVNLAWVLLSGVNAEPEEARELKRLFPDVKVRVSVIDVNDPSGRYLRAGDEERGRFLSALAQNEIGFVRRYSGGSDIHAACGMLKSLTLGGEPPPESGGQGTGGSGTVPLS